MWFFLVVSFLLHLFLLAGIVFYNPSSSLSLNLNRPIEVKIYRLAKLSLPKLKSKKVVTKPVQTKTKPPKPSPKPQPKVEEKKQTKSDSNVPPKSEKIIKVTTPKAKSKPKKVIKVATPKAKPKPTNFKSKKPKPQPTKNKRVSNLKTKTSPNTSKVSQKHQQKLNEKLVQKYIAQIAKTTSSQQDEQVVDKYLTQIDKEVETKGEVGGSELDLYKELCKESIKPNWKWPNLRLGEHLQATLKITIDSKGNILRVNLVKSSGNDFFDSSVMRAVHLTKTLPLPPKGITEIYLDFDSKELQ